MTTLPVPVMELLFSRMLHDIVSPVAAVNNGVEFMRDMGGDMSDDVIELIEHSAHQASVRLQAFRLAYGAGGSEEMVSAKMIYEAFKSLIDDARVTMEWDLLNDVPDEAPRGYFKCLMNSLMVLLETAPKGGAITVSTEGDELTRAHITGEMILLDDPMRSALTGQVEVEDLTPKIIHGYALHVFCDHFGVDLNVDQSADSLTLTLKTSVTSTKD